jgi:hypothetical protein
VKFKLYVSQLEDPFLQQNFKTIGEIFNQGPFLKGQWRFITISVAAAGTGIKYEHGLPFTPTDLLVTSVINGTFTPTYASFDKDFIVFDATVTTSPLLVRGFLGRYTEDTVNV